MVSTVNSTRPHDKQRRLRITFSSPCSVLDTLHQLNDANDLLWREGNYKWFQGKRINNPNTHGTGCTLSSAIASNLAKGFDLDTSVERAKKYISGALAAMLDLGKGSGPMDHGFAIKNEFTLSHDEITAEAADKEAK